MRRTITACALLFALCVGGALVLAQTQESAGKIPITTLAMGQPEKARAAFANVATVARNTGERLR